MKFHIKKLAVLLLAVMLFSALFTYAYADYSHDYFSMSTSTGSYSYINPSRCKSNTSDMMIDINRNNLCSFYYVRAIGTDYSMSTTVNCTLNLAGNAVVDHVRCDTGIIYAVPSVAYERGGGYATFAIMSVGAPGTVSGYWSSDTLDGNNYESPIY